VEPKVLIKAGSRFSINRKKIRRLVISILKKNQLDADVEVGVLIVGDRKMSELNQKYLGRKGPALVISFPLEDTSKSSGLGFAQSPDGILRLGDIVISYPQALKQAVKDNILIDEEIELLIKHGMKSLLGIKNNNTVKQ